MRYAIFSDIHANIIALRRVLAEAKLLKADAFLCLGDIVGYGPEPVAAVRMIRDSFVMSIAGNHDDAVCGRMPLDNFTGIAEGAVARHAEALSDDDKSFLASLPYVHRLSLSAVAVHGDMTDPDKFYYVENEDDAEANFKATNAQLIFVGHTHVPALFLTGASGKVYKMEPQDFTIEQGKRYIVNPGSVGYPREENGVCRSSFVIYDSDESTITYHYVPFLVESLLPNGKDKDKSKNNTGKIESKAPETFKSAPSGMQLAFKWFFAGCAIVALLIVLAAAIHSTFLRRLTERHPRFDQAVATDQTLERQGAVAVTEKFMKLSPRDRVVRGNLVLEKNSAPAYFVVEFTLKNGMKMTSSPYVVKKTTSREIEVPLGAQSARFLVYKVDEKNGQEVLVKSFNPTGGSRAPKKKRNAQR